MAPEALGRWAGDPVRITQILSNLLSNAVKFTAKGEVRLEVELADDGALRLSVADTGIGFDAEVRDRLFKRFMQADASTTRNFGGSGLGLSICASLAELMGGSIMADSQPGRGSRFVVVLPLPRVEACGAETPEPEAREGPALEGSRCCSQRTIRPTSGSWSWCWRPPAWS